MSWGTTGPVPSWRDDFTGRQLPVVTPVDDLSRFVMARIMHAESEPQHEVPQSYDRQAGPMAHRYAGHVRRDMVAFRRIAELYCEARWTNYDDGYQQGASAYMESAMLILANRFSDHPDFREEWRLE